MRALTDKERRWVALCERTPLSRSLTIVAFLGGAAAGLLPVVFTGAEPSAEHLVVLGSVVLALAPIPLIAAVMTARQTRERAKATREVTAVRGVLVKKVKGADEAESVWYCVGEWTVSFPRTWEKELPVGREVAVVGYPTAPRVMWVLELDERRVEADDEKAWPQPFGRVPALMIGLMTGAAAAGIVHVTSGPPPSLPRP